MKGQSRGRVKVESRILDHPNIDSEILATHTIVMNVQDTMGRVWRIAAWPKRGGSIVFCNSISELRVWEKQVLEVRKMADGRPTVDYTTVQSHKFIV